VRNLTEFLASPGHREEAVRLGIPRRLEQARSELDRVRSPEYVRTLVGTIGADPVHRPVPGRPRLGSVKAAAAVE
jgi:phosphoenolpyruvate carboxykinase (diphosphate)